jgi:hypothetical protein
MFRHADFQTCKSFPSLDLFKEKTGLSKVSVCTALKNLEQKGIIETLSHGGGRKIAAVRRICIGDDKCVNSKGGLTVSKDKNSKVFDENSKGSFTINSKVFDENSKGSFTPTPHSEHPKYLTPHSKHPKRKKSSVEFSKSKGCSKDTCIPRNKKSPPMSSNGNSIANGRNVRGRYPLKEEQIYFVDRFNSLGLDCGSALVQKMDSAFVEKFLDLLELKKEKGNLNASLARYLAKLAFTDPDKIDFDELQREDYDGGCIESDAIIQFPDEDEDEEEDIFRGHLIRENNDDEEVEDEVNRLLKRGFTMRKVT